MLFISVFMSVFFLGYLAQNNGLCMVRGVNEWKLGNKEFLFAIIFSGVLAWVAGLFSYVTDIPFHFKIYQLSGWFVFGGFIFGLGAAINTACGVSTLSRLTRGDSKMIMTVLGWLIGSIILANWQPKAELLKNPLSGNINYLLLISMSIIIIVWACLGDKKRRRLWFSMMGIGFLAGFVYLYQPKWPPSGLLNQLSQALISHNMNGLPSLEQYLLFIALLLGMFLAALRRRNFVFIGFTVKHCFTCLFAGILMGVGASLAMGGNSVQLLMGLPSFSPAGGGAVVGILCGIWGGLYITKRFKLFN